MSEQRRNRTLHAENHVCAEERERVPALGQPLLPSGRAAWLEEHRESQDSLAGIICHELSTYFGEKCKEYQN